MTTLQDQLDEITARTRELVQAERLAVGERAVEELLPAGSRSEFCRWALRLRSLR